MNTTLEQSNYGLWNKYFITMIIAFVFSSACSQLINSTMSLHVENLGGTATFTGVMSLGFTVAAAVCRVVGGRLVDKIGRRVITVVGLVIFAVASVAFMFIESFPLMVIFRAVQGMGFAISSTALMVAVSDVIPEKRMGEGLGYFGLSNSLTQAVGPAAALAIFYSALGFSGIAGTAALCMLIAAAIVFVCRYENDPRITVVKDVAPKEKNSGPQLDEDGNKIPKIWVILEKKAVPSGVVQFFYALATGVTLGFLTLYASRTGIANAGLYFTMSAIFTVLARLFGGRISDRFGAIYSLIPGLSCGIMCFVLLLLSAEIPFLYYIAGAFMGLCGGTIGPTLNAEAIRRSPPHRRGAASATFQMPLEIAFAISAIGSGVIIDKWGFSVTFIISIVCYAVAMLFSFMFFTGKRNVNAP